MSSEIRNYQAITIDNYGIPRCQGFARQQKGQVPKKTAQGRIEPHSVVVPPTSSLEYDKDFPAPTSSIPIRRNAETRRRWNAKAKAKLSIKHLPETPNVETPNVETPNGVSLAATFKEALVSSIAPKMTPASTPYTANTRIGSMDKVQMERAYVVRQPKRETGSESDGGSWKNVPKKCKRNDDKPPMTSTRPHKKFNTRQSEMLTTKAFINQSYESRVNAAESGYSFATAVKSREITSGTPISSIDRTSSQKVLRKKTPLDTSEGSTTTPVYNDKKVINNKTSVKGARSIYQKALAPGSATLKIEISGKNGFIVNGKSRSHCSMSYTAALSRRKYQLGGSICNETPMFATGSPPNNLKSDAEFPVLQMTRKEDGDGPQKRPDVPILMSTLAEQRPKAKRGEVRHRRAGESERRESNVRSNDLAGSPNALEDLFSTLGAATFSPPQSNKAREGGTQVGRGHVAKMSEERSKDVPLDESAGSPTVPTEQLCYQDRATSSPPPPHKARGGGVLSGNHIPKMHQQKSMQMHGMHRRMESGTQWIGRTTMLRKAPPPQPSMEINLCPPSLKLSNRYTPLVECTMTKDAGKSYECCEDVRKCRSRNGRSDAQSDESAGCPTVPDGLNSKLGDAPLSKPQSNKAPKGGIQTGRDRVAKRSEERSKDVPLDESAGCPTVPTEQLCYQDRATSSPPPPHKARGGGVLGGNHIPKMKQQKIHQKHGMRSGAQWNMKATMKMETPSQPPPPSSSGNAGKLPSSNRKDFNIHVLQTRYTSLDDRQSTYTFCGMQQDDSNGKFMEWQDDMDSHMEQTDRANFLPCYPLVTNWPTARASDQPYKEKPLRTVASSGVNARKCAGIHEKKLAPKMLGGGDPGIPLRRSVRIKNARQAAAKKLAQLQAAPPPQPKVTRAPKKPQKKRHQSPITVLLLHTSEAKDAALKAVAAFGADAVSYTAAKQPRAPTSRKRNVQSDKMLTLAKPHDEENHTPIVPKRKRVSVIELDDDDDDFDALVAVRSSKIVVVTSMLKRGYRGGWFDDSQIHVIFSILQNAHQNMRFVDPQMSQPGNLENAIKNVRKLKDIDGVDTIFFPMCSSEHWTLLTIRDQGWEYYDSFMNKMAELPSELAKAFNAKVQEVPESSMAPRQTDNWNCGLFVVKRAESMLTGKSWWTPETDFMVVRKELVNRLITAGYTCETSNGPITHGNLGTVTTSGTHEPLSPIFEQQDYDDYVFEKDHLDNLQFDDVVVEKQRKLSERYHDEVIFDDFPRSPMKHHNLESDIEKTNMASSTEALIMEVETEEVESLSFAATKPSPNKEDLLDADTKESDEPEQNEPHDQKIQEAHSCLPLHVEDSVKVKVNLPQILPATQSHHFVFIGLSAAKSDAKREHYIGTLTSLGFQVSPQQLTKLPPLEEYTKEFPSVSFKFCEENRSAEYKKWMKMPRAFHTVMKRNKQLHRNTKDYIFPTVFNSEKEHVIDIFLFLVFRQLRPSKIGKIIYCPTGLTPPAGSSPLSLVNMQELIPGELIKLGYKELSIRAQRILREAAAWKGIRYSYWQ